MFLVGGEKGDQRRGVFFGCTCVCLGVCFRCVCVLEGALVKAVSDKFPRCLVFWCLFLFARCALEAVKSLARGGCSVSHVELMNRPFLRFLETDLEVCKNDEGVGRVSLKFFPWNEGWMSGQGSEFKAHVSL